MPNNGKNGGFDDFWDIASLIPARKKTSASRPSRQIEATEITAPPAGNTPPTPDTRLTVKTVSNPRHTPLSVPQRVNIPQNGVENPIKTDVGFTLTLPRARTAVLVEVR